LLVVLDTNIFISALLTPHGVARRVVSAAISGDYDYAVCPKLLAEIDGVASRPKIAAVVVGASDFLADVRSTARIEPDPEVEPVSRDSDDDYLVALARVVSADHLVTGDADLLDLVDPPVAIISVRAFADLLEL
jgi:putative PIN family toxin of toxin-antitoxin system